MGFLVTVHSVATRKKLLRQCQLLPVWYPVGTIHPMWRWRSHLPISLQIYEKNPVSFCTAVGRLHDLAYGRISCGCDYFESNSEKASVEFSCKWLDAKLICAVCPKMANWLKLLWDKHREALVRYFLLHQELCILVYVCRILIVFLLLLNLCVLLLPSPVRVSHHIWSDFWELVELMEAGDPSAGSEAPATCRRGDSYQSSSPAEREPWVHPCCT